ncbi:MAG: extracellular solute-binding protein [Actinomycetaceae bacterium]|nr:extracellular solute-binding protein [Actinomycetaceae bacterium]
MLSKTKRIIAGLSAAALSFTLVGCGGSDQGSDSSSASGGGTELELLVPSYSDDTKGLWEQIIKDFEAKNKDIKVKLQMESWENINDVMRTKVQSNQAPDILNLDSFTAYANEELLYKAEDIVSPDTLSNIQEAFNKNASIGDTQWALPLFASTRALYYNKDLFEKAGIDSPPKTWDELEKDAKAIKDLGIDATDGYGMPLGNEEAQAELAIWLFGGGGSYNDGDKIAVDTPENVESAKFMKKLIDGGLTQKDPGSSQRTPLGETFFSGKLGMIIGLPQYIGFIKEKNPDLNYGIAPIPTKDGKPMTLGVADHLMAFDKGDDAKKEAITKFLDFFYSDDVYQNFVSTLGFIPITKTVGEKMKDDENLKDFLPNLPDAKFYPFTNPKWQATQGAIQAEIGRIANEDPAALLKEIQEKGTQD